MKCEISDRIRAPVFFLTWDSSCITIFPSLYVHCFSNQNYSFLSQALCMCCERYLECSPTLIPVVCSPSFGASLTLFLHQSQLSCFIYWWDYITNNYFNPDLSFMKVKAVCNSVHLLFTIEFSRVLIIISWINKQKNKSKLMKKYSHLHVTITCVHMQKYW